MYLYKEDVLVAEHELILKATMCIDDERQFMNYVDGIVSLADKMFRNYAEKENA